MSFLLCIVKHYSIFFFCISFHNHKKVEANSYTLTTKVEIPRQSCKSKYIKRNYFRFFFLLSGWKAKNFPLSIQSPCSPSRSPFSPPESIIYRKVGIFCLKIQVTFHEKKLSSTFIEFFFFKNDFFAPSPKATQRGEHG
jgi:hypothetical protein